MNNDLISRSALIAEFERIYTEHYKCTVYQFIHDIFKAMFRRLKNAPAVDAVEVVHGEWIIPTKIGHRLFNIPHCSACDGVPCGVDENTNFCPNCGAKMRERKGDE